MKEGMLPQVSAGVNTCLECVYYASAGVLKVCSFPGQE